MRLWTLHPKYLDAKGLVALWREALLAQKVLQGKTKGYRHHPQLVRFQSYSKPEAAIATYLVVIREEAKRRSYHFDGRRISRKRFHGSLEETKGQLLLEWHHLKRKLHSRGYKKYLQLKRMKVPDSHPLFRIVPGTVQSWERAR